MNRRSFLRRRLQIFGDGLAGGEEGNGHVAARGHAKHGSQGRCFIHPGKKQFGGAKGVVEAGGIVEVLEAHEAVKTRWVSIS